MGKSAARRVPYHLCSTIRLPCGTLNPNGFLPSKEPVSLTPRRNEETQFSNAPSLLKDFWRDALLSLFFARCCQEAVWEREYHRVKTCISKKRKDSSWFAVTRRSSGLAVFVCPLPYLCWMASPVFCPPTACMRMSSIPVAHEPRRSNLVGGEGP